MLREQHMRLPRPAYRTPHDGRVAALRIASATNIGSYTSGWTRELPTAWLPAYSAIGVSIPDGWISVTGIGAASCISSPRSVST